MTDYNSAQPLTTDSNGRSLADVAKLLAEKKLPPVHLWSPTHCGHSDMRIARDGTWFHAGTPIGRSALVKLFSTVLRREPDGSHVLVTPIEKLDIEVEDAAFVAVEVTTSGEGRDRELMFRLNTDDYVIVDAEHAMRIEIAEDGAPRPYLHVRGGLEALIGRAVFYELVELALAEGSEPLGLWSRGSFFPIGTTVA